MDELEGILSLLSDLACLFEMGKKGGIAPASILSSSRILPISFEVPFDFAIKPCSIVKE